MHVNYVFLFSSNWVVVYERIRFAPTPAHKGSRCNTASVPVSWTREFKKNIASIVCGIIYGTFISFFFLSLSCSWKNRTWLNIRWPVVSNTRTESECPLRHHTWWLILCACACICPPNSAITALQIGPFHQWSSFSLCLKKKKKIRVQLLLAGCLKC